MAERVGFELSVLSGESEANLHARPTPFVSKVHQADILLSERIVDPIHNESV